jgi:pimeloyl-ACP methyl ester carboxylesterase
MWRRVGVEMSDARIFISHAGKDRTWAEWVAWQLKSEGYDVELDTWDWAAGENFVERMGLAIENASCVVALLSEAYFESGRFTAHEWTAVFAGGAGPAPSLVPLRIEDMTPPLLLRPLISADLFGLTERRAREVLVTAVAGTGRPDRPPPFPDLRAVAAPPLPGALPDVWNVPPRNAAFTGRDAMVGTLRTELSAGGRVVVQALHGMGGVGKTTLAIEYAHRFAADYDIVWWADSEKVELIGEQVAQLGVATGWLTPGTVTGTAVTEVHRRLRGLSRWLVIFDNVEKPDDVRLWLPQGPGHVMITSRNPAWGQLAAPVPVDVFARVEWLALNQAIYGSTRLLSVMAIDPGGLEKVPARFFVHLGLGALVLFAPRRVRPGLARRLALGGLFEHPAQVEVIKAAARGWRSRRPAARRLDDDELRAIRVPLQLLLAEQSTLISGVLAEQRVKAVRPETHIEVVPGAGHGLTLDQPDLVNERVLAFAAAAEAESPTAG